MLFLLLLICHTKPLNKSSYKLCNAWWGFQSLKISTHQAQYTPLSPASILPGWMTSTKTWRASTSQEIFEEYLKDIWTIFEIQLYFSIFITSYIVSICWFVYKGQQPTNDKKKYIWHVGECKLNYCKQGPTFTFQSVDSQL